MFLFCNISRNLKDEEKENLNETLVAIDGIAIIVNSENSVADLTVEQIAGLYTGEISNWKDVGGSDAPVVCIEPEPVGLYVTLTSSCFSI